MWGKSHTAKVLLSDFESFKGLMASHLMTLEGNRRMDATRLMEMESHMADTLKRLFVLEQSILALHGLDRGELRVNKRSGRPFVNRVSGN